MKIQFNEFFDIKKSITRIIAFNNSAAAANLVSNMESQFFRCQHHYNHQLLQYSY